VSVQWSDELVHWVKTKALSDEPMVHFLVASDEPTVHWKEPSVYLMIKFKQDRDVPRFMQ
jgi:hypothetical protein